MRYHEELIKVRGILFHAAVAMIAIGFLIDYIRH